MQIKSVTPSAEPPTNHLTGPQRLTPANVSASVMKAAAGDGDGLTGAAALNDGDAASQAARRNAIDVKV